MFGHQNQTRDAREGLPSIHVLILIAEHIGQIELRVLGCVSGLTFHSKTKPETQPVNPKPETRNHLFYRRITFPTAVKFSAIIRHIPTVPRATALMH